MLQPPSSSSQYLTSWGEYQQTLSSPAVSSSTSPYLTSWGESQQTSSSPDVSTSSSQYLTSWGESQQTSSVPSSEVSKVLVYQRFKLIFICYSLHHLPVSISPAGGLSVLKSWMRRWKFRRQGLMKQWHICNGTSRKKEGQGRQERKQIFSHGTRIWTIGFFSTS